MESALVLVLAALNGNNPTYNTSDSNSIPDPPITYPEPTPEQLKIIQLAQVQNNYVAKRFSTKNSLYRYKNEQLTILTKFANAFMSLYFILAGIYLSIILIDPTHQQVHSYYYKITLLLLLISFPFIITPIEIVTYDVLMYCARFTFGVVAIS